MDAVVVVILAFHPRTPTSPPPLQCTPTILLPLPMTSSPRISPTTSTSHVSSLTDASDLAAEGDVEDHLHAWCPDASESDSNVEDDGRRKRLGQPPDLVTMEGNPGAIVSTRFSLTTSHLIILSDPLLGLVKFNGKEIDLVSASSTTV